MTLDLNRLDTVEVADDHSSAKVGGAATSAQTSAALEPHNLSFVGGRVGQVGVGGFTLDGGTYPFANKYGWALDNVYEYEVRQPPCRGISALTKTAGRTSQLPHRHSYGKLKSGSLLRTPRWCKQLRHCHNIHSPHLSTTTNIHLATDLGR